MDRRTGSGLPALVLIVQDTADARTLYDEYLEFCGFRVRTAADGIQGMQAAQSERPDIILVDLPLPLTDGWEAIRRLRADARTAAIPIVAVSTYLTGDEPARAREAGADVCLTKPCVPSQVARAIRALLVYNTALRSTGAGA